MPSDYKIVNHLSVRVSFGPVAAIPVSAGNIYLLSGYMVYNRSHNSIEIGGHQAPRRFSGCTFGAGMTNRIKSRSKYRVAILSGALSVIFFPATALAMTGPWVDTAANVLAIVVLLLVPIGGIYLFWKVHILPEIVAEKRHHPQKDAIKALCILSLFFGGLLWPFAWLWAYTKPTMHKLAYGTDKHEDYYKEAAPGVPAVAQEVTRLRADLERLTAMGLDADALRGVKRELAKLEGRLADSAAKEGD